jgi:phosphoribosylformylglycinamidine synthase
MKLVRAGLVGCAHDCSKGGIAVALSEMAVHGKVGFDVNLDQLPGSCSRPDNLMFSESNSRYIIGTARPAELHRVLSGIDRISFAEIGTATGQRQKQRARFSYKGKTLVSAQVANIESNLNDSLAKIMKQ